MSIDLAAYLARVGVDPAAVARPDRAALDTLILAHLRAIPFENLDIVLGRPIHVDLERVFAKLVTGRRGGYCFEHNTLFAEVLRRLGYAVVLLSSRVRWLATDVTPRTHMMLEVALADGPYLADVGFGGQCPTRALPLALGEHPTAHGRMRFVAGDPGHLLLEMAGDAGWQPMYTFTREPQYPIDFEVANHYTSTHPASRFVAGPIAARTTERGRLTYARGELVHRTGETVEKTAITTGDELLATLATRFGLDFPPGTRFRGGPA
jgi:N-hydroxyarylamine O-acetyltransferase